MLVAVSGPQGCGKTTILNGLKQKGYPIVNRKTSRSIQADWGYTLEQINSDRDLTIRFQNEILERKIEDERPFVEMEGLAFTERTYADLFTYAIMVLGKEPSCSSFIDEYYEKCKEAQKTYHKVCYVLGGKIDVEWDVNRASANKHYCEIVDVIMKRYTDKMTTDPHYRKIITLPFKEQEQRVSHILENVNG